MSKTGPPIHIVAGTVVRFTFKHTNGSRFFDNVQDISIDSSGVISRDTIVDDVLSHVCGWWQDSLLALYPTWMAFSGASWVDLDSATGRTGTLGPAGSHPTHGSRSGNVFPPQVSFLIHKNCDAHRGQRSGRMYIGPPLETDADDSGVLTAGVVTAINTAGEQFRSTIRSYSYTGDVGNHPAAWRVVHVHKPDKADSTTWTWTSTDVNSATADSKVATQRDRLR